MRKLISYFSVLLLLVACDAGKNPKPSNLIPQEKMIDVLLDVRLLEAAYSSNVPRPDTIKPKMESYYQTLFEKHGISKLQFASSYEYYLNQEDKLVVIEDSVLSKLNTRSQQLVIQTDTSHRAFKDTLSHQNKAE